ncbi:hypothetical protein FGIG_02022 [Fasciola gigantica]|uniref:Uncharacterized protein n=1 Tax=Fasciola gigantica TaxID=46835 RepID=A0A504Z3R4_FASGI|nr:hypothetical protein FGIG_02022 [Fasciola gigantica]
MFSSLALTMNGIPGLREYGQSKFGTMNVRHSACCARRSRFSTISEGRRHVNSSISAPMRRSQRCRLEDLCAEDRGKLARLVMELAMTQEALAQQNSTSRPTTSHSTPAWKSEDNADSNVIQNSSNPCIDDGAKNNMSRVGGSSSQESEKQTPQNDLREYHAQLTQMENELRQLRLLVTGCVDQRSSVSQSGLNISSTESKSLHENVSGPKRVVQDHTMIQDQNPPSVRQPRSVRKMSNGLQRTENEDGLEKREIRRKLIQDKEVLQRQRQVLYVVADQQTQIERLESEMRHMVQLVTQAFYRKPEQSANTFRKQRSNKPNKLTTILPNTKPNLLPAWQPLKVHTTVLVPEKHNVLTKYSVQQETAKTDDEAHHQVDELLSTTKSQGEQRTSDSENEALLVKTRALNYLEKAESFTSTEFPKNILTTESTQPDVVRVSEVIDPQTREEVQVNPNSRRRTHQYWTQSRPSSWLRSEPCGRNEGPPTPSKCKPYEAKSTDAVILANVNVRDAQTLTSCLSMGRDQAVQCHDWSIASGSVQTPTGQPFLPSVNQVKWTNSADELSRVLDLISDLNQSYSPSCQLSPASVQPCMVTTPRLAHTGTAVSILSPQMESHAWLESTTPVVSTVEQELLDDLFFQVN